jgi:hypothetical protein
LGNGVKFGAFAGAVGNGAMPGAVTPEGGADTCAMAHVAVNDTAKIKTASRIVATVLFRFMLAPICTRNI